MHNRRHAPVLLAEIKRMFQEMNTTKISEVQLSGVSGKHVKVAFEAWNLDNVISTVTSEATIPAEFKKSLEGKLVISWEREDK